MPNRRRTPQRSNHYVGLRLTDDEVEALDTERGTMTRSDWIRKKIKWATYQR